MEASFHQVAPPSERRFGLTLAAVLVAVAARAWWLDSTTIAAMAVAAALAAAALALLAPRTLAAPNRWWFRLGLLLSKVVSPLVVGAMFLLVVTPVGIMMRAFGRDPLRIRGRADTYWLPREPPGPAPESFRNQF